MQAGGGVAGVSGRGPPSGVSPGEAASPFLPSVVTFAGGFLRIRAHVSLSLFSSALSSCPRSLLARSFRAAPPSAWLPGPSLCLDFQVSIFPKDLCAGLCTRVSEGSLDMPLALFPGHVESTCPKGDPAMSSRSLLPSRPPLLTGGRATRSPLWPRTTVSPRAFLCCTLHVQRCGVAGPSSCTALQLVSLSTSLPSFRFCPQRLQGLLT